MSTTTLNKNLTRASQCFKWAVDNGYMNFNPAENITIKNSKRPQEERKAFSIDDLKKIFYSEQYIEDNFKYSFMFWLPIIGLFTGMRIEEICQLHLEDIYPKDGIWIFDLFEKRKDSHRKTPAGKRYIPLHPLLKDELNLPGWKEYLENNGHKRVFPELQKDKNGKYSRRPSKWFNERYKNQIKLDDPEGKVFHSFRHTFIDHLKQNGADPIVMHELDGHVFQGETFGRYGKKLEPVHLYNRGISYVDFESLGLDISHLKNSRFVVK